MEKTKILIIGATGRLGYHLTKASLDSSHPTFALVRESAFSDPIKSQKLQSLSDSGATILKVSLYFRCLGSIFMVNFSFRGSYGWPFIYAVGFAPRRSEPCWGSEASGCGDLRCFSKADSWPEASYPSHQTSWLHQGHHHPLDVVIWSFIYFCICLSGVCKSLGFYRKFLDCLFLHRQRAIVMSGKLWKTLKEGKNDLSEYDCFVWVQLINCQIILCW